MRCAAFASVLALLIVLAALAHAEENAACTQFKWPLTTEKSWFGTGKLASVASDASLATLAEGAFTVALKPSAGITFKLKPEGKEKPDKPLGAIVSFGAVAAPQPSASAPEIKVAIRAVK